MHDTRRCWDLSLIERFQSTFQQFLGFGLDTSAHASQPLSAILRKVTLGVIN